MFQQAYYKLLPLVSASFSSQAMPYGLRENCAAMVLAVFQISRLLLLLRQFLPLVVGECWYARFLQQKTEPAKQYRLRRFIIFQIRQQVHSLHFLHNLRWYIWHKLLSFPALNWYFSYPGIKITRQFPIQETTRLCSIFMLSNHFFVQSFDFIYGQFCYFSYFFIW